MSKYNSDGNYDTTNKYSYVDNIECEESEEDNYDDEKLEFVIGELWIYCRDNYLPLFDHHQIFEKFKNKLHI